MTIEQEIKERARSLGFFQCGIAKAEPLVDEEQKNREMIAKGYHAYKSYLENNIEKRFNPTLVVPEAKSVIVCLYNYLTNVHLNSDYKMAKYSFITDYHTLIRDKLTLLAHFIHQQSPDTAYKISVDSSIVTEKNWAVRAGLGFIGKNSLLQTPQGSYFLIGTITTPLLLTPDTPIKADCGACKRCMDACPTHAIKAPYQIDARKCISHLNTEAKNLESSEVEYDSKWLIGCDICQEVCPHNVNAPLSEDATKHLAPFIHFKNEDFNTLSEEDFKRYFIGTCLERRKYHHFMTSIKNAKKQL
ncbi:MAG: tRNA epoxyqueuosine(34) reductase QueG [Bacteroidales bacterium]|jgi:epoxyqueuosine reductase|nr:tRNA epoxyqueuosine(34) reductase QueG [Bacteroidales bacterium]